MVLSGTETSSVSASAPVDTQVGAVGQTVFDIRGGAAEGIREGAVVTVTSATIGGTAITTGNTTLDTEAGTVTLAGFSVTGATATQTTTNVNPGGFGTLNVPITVDAVLNAIAGGSTVTITSATLGGSAITVTRSGTNIVVPGGALSGTLVVNFSYTTYTTAGVPRGSQAARTVIITYAVGAHTLEVENIYPADRCTWQQENSVDGRGYFILGARFFSGALDAGIDVHEARLGFIGKSGRFVPVTDTN